MHFLVALVESLRGATGEGCWTDGYHCALSDIKSLLENALDEKRGTCQYATMQSLDPKMLVKNGDMLTEIQCGGCGRWMLKIEGHIDPEYCSHCGKHFIDV